MPGAEAPAPTAPDPAALVAEGLAAKRTGKFDESTAKLKEAIAQAPENVDAHWGLAWVLADQGKEQEAIAHFEVVIELTDDREKVQEAQAAIQRLKWTSRTQPKVVIIEIGIVSFRHGRVVLEREAERQTEREAPSQRACFS